MLSRCDEHPSRLTIYANMGSSPDPVIVQHVAGCPQCSRIADEREKRRQEFLANGPTPEEFARSILNLVSAQDEAQRRRRIKYAAVGGSCAVAITLALLALLGPFKHVVAPGHEQTVRHRGGATLQFVVLRIRGNEETRHASAFKIRDGDQVTVRTFGWPWDSGCGLQYCM